LRIYSHPACLLHDPGPGHPEAIARLQSVLDALRAAFAELDWHSAPLATREQLARVHTRALIATILDTPAAQPLRLDEDTVLSDGSAQAALHASGAAVAAVDAVLAGKTARAFCAVRPPGHHATADIAMGFCLFNHVAVAAAHAIAAHGLERVAIVDFDVHHGNGTQDIFARDPRVLYASSHQWPLYPGTGSEAEHGAGNVFNAPLPPGSDGVAFRAAWSTRLLPAISAFAPQLLLVSAGFDAHRLDPLADLRLEAQDYEWIGAELGQLADRHAGGRLVSMLEGGYSLTALRECSVAHLRGLGAA
jgi:acetoin utilization deacetylase AcuC-like enzyme